MKLSRSQIKILALMAMTLDHVAAIFLVPTSGAYLWMRFVGRLTAPVMSFFIAEGFHYTHDRIAYKERLLIFALISQIPFMLVFDVYTPNVMMTLWLSVCILETEIGVSSSQKNIRMLFLFTCALVCDWMIFVPLWSLIFYKNRENIKRRDGLFALVGMSNIGLLMLEKALLGQGFQGMLYHLGYLLAIPVFHMYDGRKEQTGRFVKWGFYAYYPIHLLVLYLFRIDIF